MLFGIDVKTVVKMADDNAAGCQKYIAMYDFTARNFDELSLKAGDHVMVNTLIIHFFCNHLFLFVLLSFFLFDCDIH